MSDNKLTKLGDIEVLQDKDGLVHLNTTDPLRSGALKILRPGEYVINGLPWLVFDKHSKDAL